MGYWLRKTTTVLTVVAFLLQVASIVAPGWLIYINGNFFERNSLFYQWKCASLLDEHDCSIKTFHEEHFDQRRRLVAAKVGRQKLASIDYHYSTIICQQTLTVVAVVLSLMAAISEVWQNIRKHRHNIRLILLTAVTSATSAGIVISVVSNEITYIFYEKELKDADDRRNHTYIAFPYCLVMLGGSALIHFCSCCSLGRQLYTPKIKESKPRMFIEDSTDNDRENSTETIISSYEKPRAEKVPLNDYGHDNQVFSEKL